MESLENDDASPLADCADENITEEKSCCSKLKKYIAAYYKMVSAWIIIASLCCFFKWQAGEDGRTKSSILVENAHWVKYEQRSG